MAAAPNPPSRSRQLFLHSDIDLLVLFGGHLNPVEEEALRDSASALGSEPGRGTRAVAGDRRI